MLYVDVVLSVSVDQVRTVSAKALGAMVKGMGESSFDDLLPWLMETLASEQSSVDRSGAAQGERTITAPLEGSREPQHTYITPAPVCFCLLTFMVFSIPLYLRLSGLAEVMAALGVEKLDKLMPDVVQTASKVDIASHVRDGYIMMFIYLPLTFGDKFTPYVGPIIPCILKVRRHD